VSRDQFNITSLEITGDGGKTVSNQFIQQESTSNKLAVLYPGMRYTCDRPLLYFTTELLLSKGYDVLQLWSNYNSPQFKDLSKSEKTIQIIADGQALLESGRQSGTYTQHLLCGKSLGTITMAFILQAVPELDELRTVWFTPLIHLPPVAEAILSQTSPAFIAGSLTDDTFSSGPIDQIMSRPVTSVYTSDKADHSLEIPGDTLQSLSILNQVITRLSEFTG
jgi:hypothetical protein